MSSIIVGSVIRSAVLGIIASGFSVSMPATTALAIAILVGATWHYRREPTFAPGLIALLQIVFFSTGVVLLTYLVFVAEGHFCTL